MYGPGLMLLDYNLGILYLLAMSSLATYGILLAGLSTSPPIMWIICGKSGKFRERLILSQLEAKHGFIFLLCIRVIFFILEEGSLWCIRVYHFLKKNGSSRLKHERSTTSRWVYKKYNNSTTSARSLALYLGFIPNYLFSNKTLQLFMAWLCFLLFIYIEGISLDCEYIHSSSVCMSSRVRTMLLKDIRQYYTTLVTENDNTWDLQALHSTYVRELYKNREAPVIPFDRDLILATCYHCLDKNKRSEFLKEWGSKSCIYIIEYKYNPLIYYIGRTTLFKRRFSNHLLANSTSKLHVFLKLVGWEHFDISILEVCSSEEQGARENYYLQKYLPLLNTTFSSKMTEFAIYSCLTSKLAALKSSPDSYVSGQSIPVYVYEVYDTHINKTCVKYNSITEASSGEKIARGTLGVFRDTNVPFRNKLYYSKPIINFELTFNLSNRASSGLMLNSNIAKQVWAYNAKTLELIKGSPFPSKSQASTSIGISRNVITYFIDTWKAEGVKGTYVFSRPLEAKEVESLIESSQRLELGNKIKVWVYDTKTLELINNSPFSSLLSAANHFKVNYRTISRHLDTKLASSQNKTLVYFFTKEINSIVKSELLKNTSRAHYTRTETWVYKLGENGVLNLIPDQPFKTKREATRVLKIHITVLNRYLDSFEIYKGFLIFSSPQNSEERSK